MGLKSKKTLPKREGFLAKQSGVTGRHSNQLSYNRASASEHAKPVRSALLCKGPRAVKRQAQRKS